MGRRDKSRRIATVFAVLTSVAAASPSHAQAQLLVPAATNVATGVVNAVTGIFHHRHRDPLNSTSADTSTSRSLERMQRRAMKANHFSNHKISHVRSISADSTRY